MTKMVNKNWLLGSTLIIGHIPDFFYGSIVRYDPWLLWDQTTRVDFIALYFSTAINFMILAYLVHYPKGVSRLLSRTVLIVTTLDFIHLLLFRKMVFSELKIIVALAIVLVYGVIKKRYDSNRGANI